MPPPFPPLRRPCARLGRLSSPLLLTFSSLAFYALSLLRSLARSHSFHVVSTPRLHSPSM